MNSPYVYRPLEGTVVPLPGGWAMVITALDFEKMEINNKLFTSYEEAAKWTHDTNLKQFPEWHKEHCRTCERVARETR